MPVLVFPLMVLFVRVAVPDGVEGTSEPVFPSPVLLPLIVDSVIVIVPSLLTPPPLIVALLAVILPIWNLAWPLLNMPPPNDELLPSTTPCLTSRLPVL